VSLDIRVESGLAAGLRIPFLQNLGEHSGVFIRRMRGAAGYTALSAAAQECQVVEIPCVDLTQIIELVCGLYH